MIQIIIFIVAFFITVPVIATWIIYLISVKTTGKRKKSLYRAVYWTTILYIIAVTILLNIILDQQTVGWVLIMLLTTFPPSLSTSGERRQKLLFGKLLKCFGGFVFCSFCLCIYVLFQSGLCSKCFSFDPILVFKNQGRTRRISFCTGRLSSLWS